MKITYPLAKVFIDNSNMINMFFYENDRSSRFSQIGNIGNAVVDFCELDFSEVLEELKKLDTITVPSENFEDIKQIFWNAVDLLKDKHSYAHFFLNAELVKNFYVSERSIEEQVDYGNFMFKYFVTLQSIYHEALEFCLSNEVLQEYTLSERYMMFNNLKPNFSHHILKSMYAIAPIANGKFDTSKLIKFQDPNEVDTKKVLKNIHRDSENAVSLWQYFSIETLEEMLYLEFVEMVKRGVRIRNCAFCDKPFVLSDKRKREYCDRIYKGNRTCKQIGAKQKFNKTVEQDEFLQKFQTIYNRMYSRYYRIDAWDSERETNKLSEAQFKLWSNVASDLRMAYKAGEVNGEDMIAALEESTKY